MRVQDIHYTDQPLKEAFVNKFLTGDLAGAFDILEKNKQLDNKKFIAEVLNYVGTALQTIQNYYYENVEDYLLDLNNNFNILINNFIKKDNYKDDIVYSKNNFVIYNGEVYLYINDASTSGNKPDNTNYWVYIGLRGDKGNYGIGVTMKYTWNEQITYNPLDVVYYNGTYYVAKKQNTNIIPTDDKVNWEIFLKTKPAYIATTNAESMIVNGMVWFEIFNPYTFEQLDALNYTWTALDSKSLSWADIDRGGF